MPSMSSDSCLEYLEYQIKRSQLGLLTRPENLLLFTIINQLKFTNITGIKDLNETDLSTPILSDKYLIDNPQDFSYILTP